MTIVFGCDHTAVETKNRLMEIAKAQGHTVTDVGTYTSERCDYPVYGRKAALMVASGRAERGVLVCGTGFGISLAANRVPGIRCVNSADPYIVSMSRAHNDANMIAFGARCMKPEEIDRALEIFLAEPFSGEERHARRVFMIDHPADDE